MFLIEVREGTSSLWVAVLPGIVDHLDDELDGVSDLMSPVQPLMTQAVTDDNYGKACSTRDSSKVQCAKI